MNYHLLGPFAFLVLAGWLPAAGRAAEARFTSPSQEVELSQTAPGLERFDIDGLGLGKRGANAILGSGATPGGFTAEFSRSEGGLRGEYRMAGQPAGSPPVWSIEIRDRELRFTSQWSRGCSPDQLNLIFDPGRCAVTLLGLLNPDGSVRLPALLNLPNQGSVRIAAPKGTAAAIGYATPPRGAKITGRAGITVSFPAATAARPRVEYLLTICAIYPNVPRISGDARFDSFRRNWLDALQLNPNNRMLANNSRSTTCAFCFYEYADIAAKTPPLADGLTALDVVRETLDAIIAGKQAYGLKGGSHPVDSADSLPSLLIAAGQCVEAGGNDEWLASNYGPIRGWAEKMLATDTSGDGLVKYKVSGNSGTWPAGVPKVRPSNWWDTIGFGYEDAYANALAYRALGCMERMAARLGNPADAARYRAAARKLNGSYFKTFYDPATGVLGGWRSADGQLHDYYFLWVNGIAIEYGLVPKDKANAIMDRLMTKMKQVGYTQFHLGLPGNLITVALKDYAHKTPDGHLGGGVREDNADGFQKYENGGATGCFAYFTLAALYDLGRTAEADRILFPMLEEYGREGFQGRGPNGRSNDWRMWDGTPLGYEGYLTDNYYALLAVLPPLRASLTDLWPHFSAPTSLVTFDTHAVTAKDDLLAASTLQGAYNQNAPGDRLYNLTDSAPYDYDAQWLALGSSLPVTALRVPPGQTTLQALLGYQSARHKIGGYIVYDPNCPETMNYATTLAGAFDCMVIDPSQETDAQTYGGLSLCAGGRASVQCDLTQVQWVQSNAALVGDFAINHIGTPGGADWGGSGIAGWTMDTTGTGYSLTAFPATMQYTVPRNAGGDRSVYYTPTAVVMDTDKPYEGSHAYIFSAQVYETTGASGVKVRLDVWNGMTTIRGREVTLTASNQTLQNCIPRLPGPNPARVHLVIENCADVAPSIRISNAACIRDRVGVELRAFNAVSAGQVPVSKQAMVLQTPGSVSSPGVKTGYYTELRDYAVAGKMFTFMLTHSTTAFRGDPYQSTEQQKLIGDILGNTNHNLPGTVTPVLGYPAAESNEKSDVAYLSGTGRDHFLTAAAKYRNGSVWASLPQPAVSQPAPQPIRPVANGTIYVAFQMSDGDNVGFLESYRLNDYKSAYLGDVPVGFTLNPGGVFYSPQMTSYFYRNLPACSEIVAAPSGVGYVTALDAGTDLTSFCNLTSRYLAAQDMGTVVTWENTPARVSAFAAGLSGVNHVLTRTPTPRFKSSSPGHVIDGSLVDYVGKGAYASYSDAEIHAVKTAAHGVWKDNRHAWYVEAMVDDHHLNPGDVLYIAQRMVATDPTYHYTFVTPTVLSLMEGGQAGGAPSSSPQAVTGASLTNAALHPQLSGPP